ncbi:hypothetical protein CAEBREN_32378 [Caenorhabditis brenneri]|uniref:RRM domain-containing protein n=1 Tax=Caenorhabditis brenneri TaxID=135651 RepID=G0N3T9_CAEBE|nr:hypothetical protein CAEBREN_32378 [Caenorhabditis brenneri]
MFPGDQNAIWKQELAINQSSSHMNYHTFDSDFYPLTYQRTPCPQHFPNRNQFDFLPAGYEDRRPDIHPYNPRSCQSSSSSHYSNELSSMDLTDFQIYQLLNNKRIAAEELVRQHQGIIGNGFGGLCSPPPTFSSSRSSLFSVNSVPAFVPHCSSPVHTDEFNHPFVFDTKFDFNHQMRCESANGYFMKKGNASEGFSVLKMPGKISEAYSYPEEKIYTAEDVHTVVKNNRDSTKQRIVSNKIFVGGISHSMNRELINTFFGQFGTVFVDWPVKKKGNTRGKYTTIQSYSYLFLVYSEEESVFKLMNACTHSGSEFFVTVPGCKESQVSLHNNFQIQIRPWFVKNAFYIHHKTLNERIVDVHRTVFVGGLPRIVTADEIAQMFSEFGRVLIVTIDMDQDYAYPKGAARVTFERDSSFNRALEKKYLKFENIDSSKTIIEIKPYVMEDIGCDQCGGLWYNPILDIYDQLKIYEKKYQQQNKKMKEIPRFDMWSSHHPFSPSNNINRKPYDDDSEDLISKLDAKFERNLELSRSRSASEQAQEEKENEKNDLRSGAERFLEVARSFGLDKPNTVEIDGVEYNIGPELWHRFVPPPSFEMIDEPVQMDLQQKVESFLRLERDNIYSNKSSYCKERQCRQYYCPSCSNKLHSGRNQHSILPAGKPERRPRKDKNMYLINGPNA